MGVSVALIYCADLFQGEREKCKIYSKWAAKVVQGETTRVGNLQLNSLCVGFGCIKLIRPSVLLPTYF